MGRVRKALGRSQGQGRAEAPGARVVVPEVGIEDRIRAFRAALEPLTGKVYEAGSKAEAREIVDGLTRGKRAVASAAGILGECGITGLEQVTSRFADAAAMRAALAVTDFGITGADYALADTGTLAMVSSPEEARLVSLLPPVHIAVLRKERLLSGLDELLTVMPRPAEQTSSMVLITGPSRTADIEMFLVRGVHGPGAIHVILV